jgi:hypothetical protein
MPLVGGRTAANGTAVTAKFATPHVAAAVTALLVMLALLRGAALVGNEPLIGLANNYDMIRVQGCIDAYPLREASIPPWTNSWQAPQPRYTFRVDVHPGCFVSSESALAMAIAPLLRTEAARSPDGAFALRSVGWVKLGLAVLLVGVAVLAFVARGARWGGAVVAGLAALVLFDPIVTVYFNSFYAEGIAAVFAFATVALAVAIATAMRPPAWMLVAYVVVALAACLSKNQHLLFAAHVAVALLLVAWRYRRLPSSRVLWALAGTALLGIVLQLAHFQVADLESMRRANKTNTFLMAVLGSSSDPHTTAQRLHLPRGCGDHAGKHWFTDGLQADHPCPELFASSRLALLRLTIAEPQTLLEVVRRGIPLSRPWIPPVLGKVAGAEGAPLPSGFVTFDRAITALPGPVYAALFLLPPLLVVLLFVLRPALPLPLALAVGITGSYPALALFTVVFGDGLADVAKQFHLGALSLLAFWLLAVVAIAVSLGRREAVRGDASSR